jgi:hypothetical protein
MSIPLLDLEEAVAGIDELCVSYLFVDDRDAAPLREKITPWIRLASDAIATLFQISLEQRAVSEKVRYAKLVNPRDCFFEVKKRVPGLDHELMIWIRLASDAIATLFQISLEQRAVSEKGGLLDQIGHRSARFKPSKPTSSRPHSIVSNASRLSRFSVDRSRVKGLEEEVLDGNEAPLLPCCCCDCSARLL